MLTNVNKIIHLHGAAAVLQQSVSIGVGGASCLHPLSGIY